MPDFLPANINDLVQTAVDLADIARTITRKYFRGQLSVDRKLDRSPVTIADRETEETMRALISTRHPDHGIIGEEFGVRKGESAWCWILDPIDGTKSFVCGKPTFGSLIALIHDTQPLIGVVEIPALEERWLGVHGQVTTYNGVPCQASSIQTLEEAVFLSTTPDMFDAQEWAVFQDISRKAHVRNFGTDCYGYGLLASGFADAVMESDLKPYDYMALIPVVEGAGGQITDWTGAPLSVASCGRVLASATAELHTSILSQISSDLDNDSPKIP